ncbi:MAG: hypothetical protein VB100_02930 [Angelakisella sp.]|nr:hypothetical protein [Angelakisella sp.]
MGKVLFYLPAIFFAVLYGWVALAAMGAISPVVFVWIGLFIVSGFLLSKYKFWGGLFGMLPGLHMIYMSTKDTGQVMNIELPMGLILVIFYVFCCSFVIYQKKNRF